MQENDQKVDCRKEGKVKEYVWCKMVHNEAARSLKMMQPILMQHFGDEYKIPDVIIWQTSNTWIHSYEVWPEEQSNIRKTNKTLLIHR